MCVVLISCLHVYCLFCSLICKRDCQNKLTHLTDVSRCELITKKFKSSIDAGGGYKGKIWENKEALTDWKKLMSEVCFPESIYRLAVGLWHTPCDRLTFSRALYWLASRKIKVRSSAIWPPHLTLPCTTWRFSVGMMESPKWWKWVGRRTENVTPNQNSRRLWTVTRNHRLPLRPFSSYSLSFDFSTLLLFWTSSERRKRFQRKRRTNNSTLCGRS